MKKIVELYFKIGERLGFIRLLTTEGTIEFTAWNGKKRKFNNVKDFRFQK